MNHADAIQIAVEKARQLPHRISTKERDLIIAELRINPLTIVKRNTGRSYTTLCRIAEAAL